MPDPERVHEQINEMILRAETRALAAEDSKKTLSEQRLKVEREIGKFKLLLDIFQAGAQELFTKKADALQSKEDPVLLGALEDALSNIRDLSTQASERIFRQEGALSALQAAEEAFTKKVQEAQSRARGLALQKKRVLKDPGPPPEPPTGASEAPNKDST